MNKSIAVVLAVLVAAIEAGPTTKELRDAPLSLQYLEKVVPVREADIKEYVQTTSSLLVPLIEEYGLDPMPLPNLRAGSQVKPFWVTYSAWMYLSNGNMKGLKSVQPSGEQTIYYSANTLRVHLTYQFSELQFAYRYLVRVMGLGPAGDIVGTLDRLQAVVDLGIDFTNNEIYLQQVVFRHVSPLRIRVSGNMLLDWLVNPLISMFQHNFDTSMIRSAQTSIEEAIRDVLVDINRDVIRIVQRLDSYEQ